MCFSVNVNLVREELENRYGATLIDPDNYRPSYYYHAFVFPKMPVICSGDTSSINLFTWGLIPARTKNSREAEDIRVKTFNARAENLGNKPAFSASFGTKRCIIPVQGFFEWQHRGKEKIPWYIYNAENEIISLAGLFDNWTSDTTGEIFNTFTIVTTEANELLSEIHNSTKRMPLILDRDTENKWLDITLPPVEVKDLLKPASPEMLKAHTISQLVNRRDAEKNTPELIRPYNYGQLLF